MKRGIPIFLRQNALFGVGLLSLEVTTKLKFGFFARAVSPRGASFLPFSFKKAGSGEPRALRGFCAASSTSLLVCPAESVRMPGLWGSPGLHLPPSGPLPLALLSAASRPACLLTLCSDQPLRPPTAACGSSWGDTCVPLGSRHCRRRPPGRSLPRSRRRPSCAMWHTSGSRALA